MQKLKLALVKTIPRKGDLPANHQTLLSILAELAPHRPDVILTPECFLDGYVATEAKIDAASLLDYGLDPGASHWLEPVCGFAASYGCHVIYGCIRRAPEGAYNSALVIDRAGQIAGIYDKTHLQTHDLKFQPGRALPVFDDWFGTFGVLICADRRWTETVRTLALGEARIIFNPTYGMHDERNLHMMQTRSYESEVIIAFAHPEQSLVTGPVGEVLCCNTSPAGRWTLCEVDLEAVDAARAASQAHLRDRRPDLYA